MKRQKIQDELRLKHRESFVDYYLNPAMKTGYIEMTIPDALTSKNQQYRLTAKGKKTVQKLRRKTKNKK